MRPCVLFQMIFNDESHLDPQNCLHSVQLGVSASQVKGRGREQDAQIGIVITLQPQEYFSANQNNEPDTHTSKTVIYFPYTNYILFLSYFFVIQDGSCDT